MIMIYLCFIYIAVCLLSEQLTAQKGCRIIAPS